MRRSRLRRAFAASISAALLASACSDGASDGDDPLPAVLTELLATPSAGGARTLGDDHFEVWICHVPSDSTAAMYGGLPLRLALSPEAVTATVSRRVPAYFESLSHGLYRPVFTAGGEVSLASDENPQGCIDRAIEGAGVEAEAVLVVADAEHAADQPGGFGSGGEPCPTAGECSVVTTRRAAYVGASDFHPDWGDDPPMDLVEHEIGHSLGWVHSGTDEAGSYLSGLDLMSNSAAPRDTDPTRRDAPGTLGLNLFLAGWLPADDVRVATGTAKVRLSPSNGDGGIRLLVLDNGVGAPHTVELLTADGFNAHLPASGIAVHEVQIRSGVLGPITPLVGAPPYTALLQPGADFKIDEWTLSIANDWTITAERSLAA